MHSSSRLLPAREATRRSVRTALCAVLSALAVAAVPGGPVRAEWVSTPQALAGEATRVRAELDAWFDRAEVRSQLEQLGIEPQEARARVASLSDAEVLELEGRIDELPAGGATLVGIVGGAAIVIISVLVVTDLLALTDVFPFIRPLSTPAPTTSSR